MKKVFLPLIVCAAMSMSVNAVESGKANIYASGLKVTDTGVQFVLNTTPTEVKVNFYNGSELVKSILVENGKKGINDVLLESVFDVEVNTSLTWEVVATAEPTTFVDILSDPRVPEQQFYTPNDVVVDNDPSSANFGRVYITNGEAAATNNRTSNLGVYILDATLSDVTGQGESAYTGGVNWITNFSSPYRLALDEEGNLFVGDWSDDNSGIWIMDTKNPSANFKQVFGGARNDDGMSSESGVNIHGSIIAMCVIGKGEERTLYTYDEDYTDGSDKVLPLLGYKIGNLETAWASAPTWSYANGSQNASFNKVISNVKYVGDMCSDKRGGFWVSQYRGSLADTHPGLAHFNSKGEIDYITNMFVDGNQNYAFAINEKGDKIVYTSSQKVNVGNITYDELGVPEITLDEERTEEFSTLYGSDLGNRMSGVAFDVADNVYITSYSYSFLGVYSLPKAENTYTTPANVTLVVKDEMTGIADVAVDANAPVEYYNLQGVKVENPANGIFVKKQAGKATKVIL